MLRVTLEERKEYLAQIAASVFAQKGYRDALLQDVADEAGISKSGIYHYFNSKDEILHYLLTTKQAKLLDKLNDCTSKSEENGLSPEGALRELIYTYARFINDEKDLCRVVRQDRHHLTGEGEAELKGIERQIFYIMKEQVMKLPQVNKKYDSNIIASMIISMSNWVGLWPTESVRRNQDDALKQSTDIVLHGIF